MYVHRFGTGDLCMHDVMVHTYQSLCNVCVNVMAAVFNSMNFNTTSNFAPVSKCYEREDPSQNSSLGSLFSV